jgi:hypothetical protein
MTHTSRNDNARYGIRQNSARYSGTNVVYMFHDYFPLTTSSNIILVYYLPLFPCLYQRRQTMLEKIGQHLELDKISSSHYPLTTDRSPTTVK